VPGSLARSVPADAPGGNDTSFGADADLAAVTSGLATRSARRANSAAPLMSTTTVANASTGGRRSATRSRRHSPGRGARVVAWCRAAATSSASPRPGGSSSRIDNQTARIASSS